MSCNRQSIDPALSLAGSYSFNLSVKEAKDAPSNATQIVLSLEHDAMKQKIRIPWDKTDKHVALPIP